MGDVQEQRERELLLKIQSNENVLNLAMQSDRSVCILLGQPNASFVCVFKSLHIGNIPDIQIKNQSNSLS